MPWDIISGPESAYNDSASYELQLGNAITQTCHRVLINGNISEAYLKDHENVQDMPECDTIKTICLQMMIFVHECQLFQSKL